VFASELADGLSLALKRFTSLCRSKELMHSSKRFKRVKLSTDYHSNEWCQGDFLSK
jgi:hypothetical protein